MPDIGEAPRWSLADVLAWLDDQGLHGYKALFTLAGIDGRTLLTLTSMDLRGGDLHGRPKQEQAKLIGCIKDLWTKWSESRADAMTGDTGEDLAEADVPQSPPPRLPAAWGKSGGSEKRRAEPGIEDSAGSKKAKLQPSSKFSSPAAKLEAKAPQNSSTPHPPAKPPPGRSGQKQTTDVSGPSSPQAPAFPPPRPPQRPVRPPPKATTPARAASAVVSEGPAAGLAAEDLEGGAGDVDAPPPPPKAVPAPRGKPRPKPTSKARSAAGQDDSIDAEPRPPSRPPPQHAKDSTAQGKTMNGSRPEAPAGLTPRQPSLPPPESLMKAEASKKPSKTGSHAESNPSIKASKEKSSDTPALVTESKQKEVMVQYGKPLAAGDRREMLVSSIVYDDEHSSEQSPCNKVLSRAQAGSYKLVEVLELSSDTRRVRVKDTGSLKWTGWIDLSDPNTTLRRPKAQKTA